MDTIILIKINDLQLFKACCSFPQLRISNLDLGDHLIKLPLLWRQPMLYFAAKGTPVNEFFSKHFKLSNLPKWFWDWSTKQTTFIFLMLIAKKYGSWNFRLKRASCFTSTAKSIVTIKCSSSLVLDSKIASSDPARISCLFGWYWVSRQLLVRKHKENFITFRAPVVEQW